MGIILYFSVFNINLIIKIMAKNKYSKKDLVAFGNYLLSDKRKALVKQNINGQPKQVSHADLENFKEICKSQKDVVV